MDADTRNLQNEFFNAARKEKKLVTVFLANGKKLVGRVKSFDKFTLLLESHHGEQIIYKHAVSTVSAATRPPSGQYNHDGRRNSVTAEGQQGAASDE